MCKPLLPVAILCFIPFLACLRPPPRPLGTVATVSQAAPPAIEKMADLEAWTAAGLMSPAINIGNTLENTTAWETGWGNPLITKDYVQGLARLGFKTVRLPVAWNTYAEDGRIQADKFARVSEVVNWIIEAGMFCVLNIHWDGGWNQLFIDTVRKTGGNNSKRLLMVTGFSTDITKTCNAAYKMPKDTVPHKLFISVHYYTPYPFCGLTEDADWGKMMMTWGSPADVKELEKLFDMMQDFCTRNDVPAFVGEFGVVTKKESASRIRWMSAVMNGALSRKMIPALWDTGEAISRHEPYSASPDLLQTLRNITRPPRPPGDAAPAPAQLP